MQLTKCVFVVVNFSFLFAVGYSQNADIIQKNKSLDEICKRFVNNENYDSLYLFAKTGYAYSLKNKFLSQQLIFSNYCGLGYARLGFRDSSLKYYQITENLAYQLDSEEQFVHAQQSIANLYYALGNADSLTAYINKMSSEINVVKDASVKISLLKGLADLYTEENQYEKAVNSYLEVLKYYQNKNDKRSIGVALVNIGNIYLQMSNSTKALPYLLSAMSYLSDYEYGQIICADNIGAAYSNLKLYDSAIIYHEKAINIARKIKDTDDIYAGYEKLSFALIGKKEYNKAEKYLKTALQYALSTNTATEIIDGEDFLGESEFEQKKYEIALTYFSKALECAQKSNHAERVNELYKWIAVSADSAHSYQLAAKYYSQYILLNDSLIQESSKKTIAELETKYQTSQKEQQIKLLNQKSETQSLALHDQRNTTWFLLAGFIFIVIIITIYIKYRSRLNQLKKLTDVRNNISRDLHDEIGATLSSINIYSEVAKNKLENNQDQVQLLLQCIYEGSSQMMEGMSDIVWYVNPKNDIAENVIIKMREYAAPVLEAKQTYLNFIADDNVKKIKLNMQQRQNFYLLFKEAINNIAKYAHANNAEVNIKIVENFVHLNIKDDGKGFNINSNKQGNGLNNIQQRTKFLKGNCIIKSAVNEGASIEINFPVSL